MLLSNFFIYSLVGWIIETICNSFIQGCYTNNHLLLLPFCPMYGIASIIMIKLVNRKQNIVIIFMECLVIATLVEFFTSLLLEKIFEIRWWDYSQKSYNFQGRISLINALEFGLLGTILIYVNKYVKPLSKNLINVFIIIMSIDILVSSMYTYFITQQIPYNDNVISEYIKKKVNNLKF